MYNNLPDCMYDYRPDVFHQEESQEHSDTYCEKCGKEITEQEYDELEGYCYDCDIEREEEEWV